MPKRLKKRTQLDANQLAHQIVRLSTNGTVDEDDGLPVPPKGLSAYMAALGAKGGRVSGAKRMENLSDAIRSEIALKAATARWEKERAKKKR